MNYTHISQHGATVLSRITPLGGDVVRFSLTARIPDGTTRFTAQALSLYAALLLTRTEKKQKAAIETYIKQYGINITVHNGNETITFTGNVRSEHTTRLTALLKELIFEPLVDEKEYTQKKTLALEANREAHDDAKRITNIAFTNTLYAHEPRLQLDTLKEESAHIKKLTKGDIEEVQHALLTSAWFLSIVGNTDAEQAFLPLLHALAKHATPYTHTPIDVAPVSKTAAFTTVPSKTNVEVAIGNNVRIKSDDPTFPAFEFGVDVLGKKGGFFGRLMSTVREKEGLTYGIYAMTHTHHRGDALSFAIRTFFMAKDYEKGMASTLRELRSIVLKGVTDTEMTIFKEVNKNQYILAHESNMTRLNLYHALLVRGYTEAQYKEHQDAVAKLTRTEVNDALKHNIDLDCLVISASGPITDTGTPIIPEKT